MKKLLVLTLVAALAILFTACEKDEHKSEEPKLSSVDFENLYAIYGEDMQVAKSNIKGTFISDTTFATGEVVLTYTLENSDMFTVNYAFDKMAKLTYIRIFSNEALTNTIAYKKTKEISDAAQAFFGAKTVDYYQAHLSVPYGSDSDRLDRESYWKSLTGYYNADAEIADSYNGSERWYVSGIKPYVRVWISIIRGSDDTASLCIFLDNRYDEPYL